MQAKLNIILKLATELGMTVVAESSYKVLGAMGETDRLRLRSIELADDYKITDESCDKLIQNFNDIKKKSFEIKILEGGKIIQSKIELKELKSRGIEKLVNIPTETIKQVRALEGQILSEQDYLTIQRKKSKPTIVEENNLLPSLNFRVGVSLLLTLCAGIFVILGYIASTDERFYDKNFGYWSMLLGGLGLLITLNIFVIRIVQAFRFQMNKQKAIEDLASKYMTKLESDFESLESILRSKIFALESVVYSDACRRKFLQFRNELKDLKKNVSKHFR
jgi:hypothetical protein